MQKIEAVIQPSKLDVKDALLVGIEGMTILKRAAMAPEGHTSSTAAANTQSICSPRSNSKWSYPTNWLRKPYRPFFPPRAAARSATARSSSRKSTKPSAFATTSAARQHCKWQVRRPCKNDFLILTGEFTLSDLSS